jgi:hypothetical protein
MDFPNKTDCTEPEPDLGLLATGVAGEWSVDIDENVSGPEDWFAQIEGPGVYLSFPIVAPNILGDTLRLLDRSCKKVGPGTTKPLHLGQFGQHSVTLIQDDEYPDRCFLVIGPEAQATVRVTVAGNGLHDLTECFRQVVEELRSDGLLESA